MRNFDKCLCFFLKFILIILNWLLEMSSVYLSLVKLYIPLMVDLSMNQRKANLKESYISSKILSAHWDKKTYVYLCVNTCVLTPDYISPLWTLFVLGENQKTLSLSFSIIKAYMMLSIKSYHSVLIEILSHFKTWLKTTGMLKSVWISILPSSC